ncbi:MAG: UDP-2,3-diacylglucosamine diphosphatase [Desulfarculaceae bacterium]|jgi:UDP-2,3-diacylglucosamine pyrophosphatase LpxH
MKPELGAYKALFISDVHLGTKQSNAQLIDQFLKCNHCQELYIVGDLIDCLKIRRAHFWSQEHSNVVRRLLSLSRRGVKVTYVLGNHDAFVERFLEKGPLALGNISIVSESVFTSAHGRRFLVNHGHEFDRIIKYSFLINRFGEGLYSLVLRLNRWLNLLQKLMGRPSWSLASFIKFKVRGALNLIYRFEEIIADECRRRGFDGVICGHIHHAGIKEVNGAAYINCGDWVDSNTAVVEHFDGRFELLHYQGDEASDQDPGQDDSSWSRSRPLAA